MNLHRTLAVLALGLFSLGAFAAQKAPLANALKKAGGTAIFHAGGDWYPYPAYSDRDAWNSLTGDRAGQLIANGEKYLDYEWRLAKATDYLDFERRGSREKMWQVNNGNHAALTTLTLAELAEGKGRFLDQIIDGVFLMTERTTWVHSYHQARQPSGRALADGRYLFIDLGAQQWASDLAVVWHFFHEEFDKVDPSISAALQRAMRRQIFEPYLDPAKEKAQGWLGLNNNRPLNNWTAWCNANVILAFLLMDDDEAEMRAAVERSIRSMDRYITSASPDGACDEGPGYWSHAAGKLRDYLRTVSDASGGKMDFFSDPQVKAMGEYISRVYIGDGWSVNFSDASARSNGSVEEVFRYGADTGSDEMMDYAICLSDLQSPASFNKLKYTTTGYDINRVLDNLRYDKAFTKRADDALAAAGGDHRKMRAELRRSVPECTWYPETKHFFARNGNGWFLAAKGGHNAESHNHNDVGSIVLFIDSVPLLVDAGVETYSRKTFSNDRYTLWTMQSSWHNLPDINGTGQMNGRNYKASSQSADQARKSFSADIAGAYPEEAACKSWKRTVSLGDDSMTLTDTYVLTERKAPDCWHFLARGTVALAGELVDGKKLKKGEMVLTGFSDDRSKVVRLKIAYPKELIPTVEGKTIEDRHLGSAWGNSLCRISLTSPAGAPLKGTRKMTFTRLP